MRSTGSTRFALGTAVTGLCLGSRGRGESTNRLDLRKEDEACCISSENEKPADLSFTCFQGEAWRVCHLQLYEHPRRLSSVLPRNCPDRMDPRALAKPFSSGLIQQQRAMQTASIAQFQRRVLPPAGHGAV